MKGKLEMVKRTLEIKPVKKILANDMQQSELIYKDASDISGDEEVSDAEDGESEEEIREIPIGKGSKRRQIDQMDDYD